MSVRMKTRFGRGASARPGAARRASPARVGSQRLMCVPHPGPPAHHSSTRRARSVFHRLGLLSPSAFGHTGFTGTSIWVDPELDVVAVLLTNATHPRVDLDKPVNALRARFANAVASAVVR